MLLIRAVRGATIRSTHTLRHAPRLAILVCVVLLGLPGSIQARKFPGDARDKIVFTQLTKDLNEAAAIWSVNADGTGLRRLVPGVSDPAKSADGRRIVYLDTSKICIVNADATGRRCTNAVASGGPLSWSPDGRTIAYAPAQGDPGFRKHSIAVVRLDGGAKRMIRVGKRDPLSPAWSPDGRRLAFTPANYEGGGVYAVNIDGSGLKKLVARPASEFDTEVEWSPNGTRLLFVGQRASSASPTGTAYAVYSVAIGGGGLTKLVSSSSLSLFEAASWSADGKKIAYVGAAGDEIDVFDLRTRHTRRLRLNPCANYRCEDIDW